MSDDYELLMERRNLFVAALGRIESILRVYRLYEMADATSQAERDCIAVLQAVDDVFRQEEQLTRDGL